LSWPRPRPARTSPARAFMAARSSAVKAVEDFFVAGFALVVMALLLFV
jgi:hypothetical protein